MHTWQRPALKVIYNIIKYPYSHCFFYLVGNGPVRALVADGRLRATLVANKKCRNVVTVVSLYL
jgi:hypothetical protein